MNNYSWLQQKLHQFVLSSKLMRESTFDMEYSFTKPAQATDHHVFIAGLARSGTTILLNAIYHSNEFASLSYQDMPFVLSPNLWSKWFMGSKKLNYMERSHQDGIMISTESPEAFEEVFWTTFDDTNDESIQKFNAYVQLITHKYHKKRYLSKNNQNIRRLELLSESFPRSQILIPFRDPTQHAYSLLNQHKKFAKDSSKDKFLSHYMKLIGHTEFGPYYIPISKNNLEHPNAFSINHWIEQWFLTYESCLENLANKENVIFLCYEELCKSKESWPKILEKLNIKRKYDFEFQESKKEILLELDSDLSYKSNNLYTKLFDLAL